MASLICPHPSGEINLQGIIVTALFMPATPIESTLAPITPAMCDPWLSPSYDVTTLPSQYPMPGAVLRRRST